MSSTPLGPGDVLGGYRLLEPLGEGGMGEVWRARNLKVERIERALKLIRLEMSNRDEYRVRFLREADALARLEHPNILRLYDFGEQDGILYLTTELLSGDSVDRVLRKGPLAFERVVEIGAQTLAGLAHAHAAAVIHRDIKPANLFQREDGVVKVIDFGIAHTDFGGTLTTSGYTAGSPAYYAPEFADGVAASAASDVYAFGITLFQMATGALPFKGGGGTPDQVAVALMLQHARHPLPPPESVRSGIPAPILEAIERSTLKKPAERPTARELERLLRPGPPSAAFPATPVEFFCGECFTASTAPRSWCTACRRPLPPLARALWPARPERQPKVWPRQPSTEATATPLPPAVVADVESIARTGRPARHAPLFTGRSFREWLMVGLSVLPGAGAAVIIFAVMSWQALSGEGHGATGRDLIGAVLIGGLLVGLAGLALTFVVEPLLRPLLRAVIGQDRLMGECRELVLLADEGWVQHDRRGLSFIPWKDLKEATLKRDDRVLRFRFVDGRTAEAHQLSSQPWFLGGYRAKELREMAEKVSRRAG